MRTITLCHLSSHIPVDVGDTLAPPDMEPGVVFEIDTKRAEIAISYGGVNLRTSLQGAGLAWMDQVYVKPRPASGAVNHGATCLDG